MEEAIQYFLAADTIGMSPFKWGMTAVFTVILVFFIYLTWKRGYRDIDLLTLLLIIVILFRSSFAIFLKSESPDQALRLLFFLFPVAMAILTHFLFTKYNRLRKEQIIIGSVAVILTLINLSLGGALIPDSPHWWSDIYPLKPLNRTWLIAGVIYSTLAVLRTPANKKPYAGFIKIVNISLIIYLIAHYLLSIHTTMNMYWLYRYHGFVSDLVILYAFGYLLWHLYRSKDDALLISPTYSGLDIYEVMARVPADKLIYHLKINNPESIPKELQSLTPRQQLQALLMIHKVSVKECADYCFVTPQAVRVYRSRIRKKLG